jgi:hypothetical protein
LNYLFHRTVATLTTEATRVQAAEPFSEDRFRVKPSRLSVAARAIAKSTQRGQTHAFENLHFISCIRLKNLRIETLTYNSLIEELENLPKSF